jgi:hypothetical protein
VIERRSDDGEQTVPSRPYHASRIYFIDIGPTPYAVCTSITAHFYVKMIPATRIDKREQSRNVMKLRFKLLKWFRRLSERRPAEGGDSIEVRTVPNAE